MMGRVVWFVAGAGAGVYASVRARRLAYRLTPAGVADQIGAAGVGLRAFGDEVRAGMAEHDATLVQRWGLPAQARASRPALEEHADADASRLQALAN
ncbi:MAG: DUF6167 family protein [Nocardioidaceae bacterium]